MAPGETLPDDFGQCLMPHPFRRVEAITFPVILANGGYTATFGGTPTLLPSASHAGVITP